MSQCTSCGGFCKKSGCERADYVPPKQEPVAWMDRDGDLYKKLPSDNWNPPHTPLYTTPPQPEKQRHLEGFWCKDLTCKKCYSADFRFKHATQPQRTWVGLTDEEIDQGLLRSDYAFKTAEEWRAGVVFAMTKLKEKNT